MPTRADPSLRRGNYQTDLKLTKNINSADIQVLTKNLLTTTHTGSNKNINVCSSLPKRA